MAEFTLNEVLEATRGVALKQLETSFRSVATDTRKIESGALFVALCGERFDGHDFVSEAAAAGAAGVIVSRAYAEDALAALHLTVMRVEDTLAAYQALAAAHRARFSIPVVAVTGSNGKTTTKDLTAAVLGETRNVLKTQANYNNEIGLPLTLLQLNERYDAAVVEMGMRGLGQIKALAKIARPTVGIVTNVGETHIELLGSLENIAQAKRELVEAIDAEGTVILNADNAYVKAMAKAARGKVITFGCGETGDVRAANLRRDGMYTAFDCLWQGASYPLRLPMLGRHNVENALAAVACALSLGMEMPKIQAGLDAFTGAKMRLELARVGAYTVINDAYNASPASMAAAVDTLAEVAQKRRIAVLGDMLELGEAAAAAHEAIGRRLAAKKIDAVVTIGVLGAQIAAAAQANGVRDAVSCETHEEAGWALKALLQPEDTILFKGSRSMQMEKIIALL